MCSAVPVVRNPKAEASERLGGRYEVRVLEPSPPAVDDGEFFADDPALRGEAPPGALVVGPTTGSDLTWDGLGAGDPEISAWCADRWLGSWRRLSPLPPTFIATRESLRRLACYVLAPARKAANGKIGLRFTHGGFGTPFYWPKGSSTDEQLRVVGAQLVRQQGGEAAVEDITTLEAAAAFAGASLSDDPGVGSDLPGLGDPAAPLAVDEAASGALGEWFGFAASILEQFRAELDAAGETSSRVQLWPEHFDLGMNIEGVNFGCSPGDAGHPEPYVYVGPWDRTGLSGDYWSVPFGALLPYVDLLAARDQRLAALTFLRHGAALSRG
jgi:hypothetical protein